MYGQFCKYSGVTWLARVWAAGESSSSFGVLFDVRCRVSLKACVIVSRQCQSHFSHVGARKMDAALEFIIFLFIFVGIVD